MYLFRDFPGEMFCMHAPGSEAYKPGLDIAAIIDFYSGNIYIVFYV